MSDGETPLTPPRIFISYAQFAPAHAERVLALPWWGCVATAGSRTGVHCGRSHAGIVGSSCMT
jgi:hypothetical protein